MSLFNRALWRKTIVESMILLVPCTIVILGFTWLFVYLTNNLAISKLPTLLKYILPTQFLQLNSMSLDDWGTRRGLLSAIYIHPVVELTCIVWAVVRGSAAVSGEISRGTMEMLLSQPVSRSAIVVVNAVTTLLGAAVLSGATLVGLAIGVATIPQRVEFDEEPPAATSQAPAGGIGGFVAKLGGEFLKPLTASPKKPPEPEKIEISFYVPAATILFLYVAAIAAVTTLVSSWDHYRFRTIGIVGIWGVLQIVMDVAVRWVSESNPLRNLRYGTLKTCFEPQQVLFCDPKDFSNLMWTYSMVFVVVIVLCYAVGTVVFNRRDLPTPL
jgi:ABC-2 type transport system permease protein